MNSLKKAKIGSKSNALARKGRATVIGAKSANEPTRLSLTGWRPPYTVAQDGSMELNWSQTFHVNTPSAFINGLFGLYSSVFEDFLNDAGKACALGETVLYQVKNPVHLRFEIRKIGPNEYEVRGAHFATPSGTNICLGMDPLER